MLFDPDTPKNTLFQIEVIFNIGTSIYLISFRLNNLVLIFISKKLLWNIMTRFQSLPFEFVQKMSDLIIRVIFIFHNTLSSYYNCKKERFKLYIISFLFYHLINQTIFSLYIVYIY